MIVNKTKHNPGRGRKGVPLIRLAEREWLSIVQRYRSCCVYCGAEFHWMTLTKDHILPKSRGGKSTNDNFAPACRACNQMKANLTPREYAAVLRIRGQNPSFLLPAALWVEPA